MIGHNLTVRSVPGSNSCVEQTNKGQSNWRKATSLACMKRHLEGRRDRRGSAMEPFERAMVVSYTVSPLWPFALSLTIRPQFANGCLAAQVNDGQSGPKFWEEGLNQCKPNFNTIWQRQGAVVCKKSCWYLLPFEHNARTWQTAESRPRNGNASH